MAKENINILFYKKKKKRIPRSFLDSHQKVPKNLQVQVGNHQDRDKEEKRSS